MSLENTTKVALYTKGFLHLRNNLSLDQGFGYQGETQCLTQLGFHVPSTTELSCKGLRIRRWSKLKLLILRGDKNEGL
jgi:hypothetical protein